MRQCITISVVGEGWLLLDIGWFVLFLCSPFPQIFHRALSSNKQGDRDYITGLVQTSSEETRTWSSSQNSFSPWTWALLVWVAWALLVWVEQSLLWRMSLDIFIILFLSPWMFVYWFYNLSALVGRWSSVSIWRIFTFLNECPFDYAAFIDIGKVWIPWIGLTLIGDCRYPNWTSQVGPRPLCNRSFCGVFVLSLYFFFFECCCYRGFCHRTEPDIFLFPLIFTIRDPFDSNGRTNGRNTPHWSCRS